MAIQPKRPQSSAGSAACLSTASQYHAVRLSCALAGWRFGLVIYRRDRRLGPSTGLNDGYPWGIWKTFNIMVLTGLGSGGFADRHRGLDSFARRLHAVMRTALLTSFVAYLGPDRARRRCRPARGIFTRSDPGAGTPSRQCGSASCMPLYCLFPAVPGEHPAVLETLYYYRRPIARLVV